MMFRIARDRRGSVLTVFAFSAMVLSVMTAIVMNQISFYWAKRKLQSSVDMAALMVMQSGDISAANAKALLISQGGSPNVEVTLVRGHYSADAGIDASKRFIANATPINALQLDAKIPADKVMFGDMLGGNLKIAATARAARHTTASVVMGSRLVRVEGGLSAALLNSTLGYNGKLTVMDYNSLASANVDAGQFLQALNIKANIKAATFDDVLNSQVTVGQIISALAATNKDGTVLAWLGKASPQSSNKVILNKILDLGSMTHLPIDSALGGGAMPISVGEILAGSVSLADGDHQVAVDLASVLGDPTIANASLDVGEKPQVLDYKGSSDKGTSLSTSQFKLNIGALGAIPATAVKVDVSLANATVTIDDINCHADGKADVTLKAVTSAASVGLKASILPKINVGLGSGESKSVKFSPDDIKAQTYKPVRSGLGLQLGGLTVAQKLLFNPVDALLEKVGLHVAEADVKVIAATCGSAGLVY
ncbi:MAG TPA: TadG family pilus assembly protein [Hyphomonadaceae bacterium]|nr:TadG family pilus assembly protein [Hyphomonadaceae bacterium]